MKIEVESGTYVIVSLEDDISELFFCHSAGDLTSSIRSFMSEHNVQEIYWMQVTDMNRAGIKVDLFPS